MTKKLVTFSLLAATLWCGAAIAQDTNSEAPAETQGAGDGLDLGEAGPRVGAPYTKEKFGEWEFSCIKTETGNDPCALVQLLNGPDGEPIAEITVARLPEGRPAVAWANVIVPLETLLTAQLSLSIDGAPGKRYVYHHCTTVGCMARIGLTQGDVDAMKAGSNAELSLVPAPYPDQVLKMNMSLGGFTAGYDTLAVPQN